MRHSRGPKCGILPLKIRVKVKIIHSLRHWPVPDFAFYAVKSIFLVINPRLMPVNADPSPYKFYWLTSAPPLPPSSFSSSHPDKGFMGIL